MSRDAIAEVLGRLDYGDAPDDVEYPLRLAEVDGLLAAGVVVDVEELITSDSAHLWHDLRRVLHPLGWRVVIVWCDGNLIVAWSLPHVTPQRIRGVLSPYITVDAYGDGTANIIWNPAIPRHDDDLPDSVWDDHTEDTADALLTWLGTP